MQEISAKLAVFYTYFITVTAQITKIYTVHSQDALSEEERRSDSTAPGMKISMRRRFSTVVIES